MNESEIRLGVFPSPGGYSSVSDEVNCASASRRVAHFLFCAEVLAR
jgi:hypothetical protein